MKPSRGIVINLFLVGFIFLHGTYAETRYFLKMKTNSSNPYETLGDAGTTFQQNDKRFGGNVKSRSSFRTDDETMIRESLKANHDKRNSFTESSTFDPDVLNKFLDDYANKIKSTTEKNYNYPFRVTKPIAQHLSAEINGQGTQTSSTESDREVEDYNKTSENAVNSTLDSTTLNQQDLNDTIKRNKYYSSNPNDDRNGWVTLDAIPWSKSKISKWQANPSSQRPWPEMKIWEKPSNGKPWGSEYPSRPAYINNEPWPESPKPHWSDYQSDRPSMRPAPSTRPSYLTDRYEDNPNQAQKWPPERPASSWEKFPASDINRPNSEIITDDRPTNFPSSWDKYAQTSNKPTYSYNDNNRNRYSTNSYNQNNNNGNKHNDQESHDWRDQQNNYPSKFENIKDKPTNFGRPTVDHNHHHHNNLHNSNHHQNRPQLSSYQYTPDHPPSHPSSGDGQWVLLSTNRGYSKSRQRSMKIDMPNGNSEAVESTNTTMPVRLMKQDNDGTIAVMTSKRQVRLTVLPSVNGTNTTTSHGGLLEVERTFKTVDQSQKEYEASKLTVGPTILKKRPMRHTIAGNYRPSNSAVLAAVGAGMLPATMAMMIPMMLGRKKRSAEDVPLYRDTYIKSQRRRSKLFKM